MKKLYFTTTVDSFVYDWNEIDKEPDNIQNFEFLGGSEHHKRYELIPGNEYRILMQHLSDEELSEYVEQRDLMYPMIDEQPNGIESIIISDEDREIILE